MATRDNLRLDRRQELLIWRLLETISPATGHRAVELYERGGVQEVWWEQRGRVLRAAVQGKRLYAQLIRFHHSEAAEALCTCPGDGGNQVCRHIVAALLEAVGGLDQTAEHEPLWADGDDGDDDEDLIDVVPEEAEPAVADPPGPPRGGVLVEALVGRLGRPLRPAELDRVAAIETQLSTGPATIPVWGLFGLAGVPQAGWGDAAVPLWPEYRPPANAKEAWLYIAHALRAVERLPKTDLFRVVPWDEVDALVTPWLREMEAEAWKERLTDLASFPRELSPSPSYRLRLTAKGGQLEWCRPGAREFQPLKSRALREALSELSIEERSSGLDQAAWIFLNAVGGQYDPDPFLDADDPVFPRVLDRLLRMPGHPEWVVSPDGVPLARPTERLRWVLNAPASGSKKPRPAAEADGHYELRLELPDGRLAPRALVVLPGTPALRVTTGEVYAMEGSPSATYSGESVLRIPAGAIETAVGISALDQLGAVLPEALTKRIDVRPLTVAVRCRFHRYRHTGAEFFQVRARAMDEATPIEQWDGLGWRPIDPDDPGSRGAARRRSARPLVRHDRSAMAPALEWLNQSGVTPSIGYDPPPEWIERRVTATGMRGFPDEFLAWLDRRPDGVAVELDAELDSLRHGRVAGTVRLDAEETTVDWFDLRVALDVSDLELTPEEVALLLKACGRWVRLPDKGWRRLEFKLTPDDERQLADLGLGINDLAGDSRQRFHVLQLAADAATRLLPAERVEQVRRRAAELRTEVAPAVPTALTATLRPYQLDGYHFLAYLSTNRFGGVLADDMGLGKTVQTLAWLAWVEETGQLGDQPALVVCPKSVQANWRAEAAKFFPSLRIIPWSRGSAGRLDEIESAQPTRARRKGAARAAEPAAFPGLLIINYAQLRLYEDELREQPWSAVILDEAQSIKNPSSQTAKAACAMTARFRLALSGTPIENRLLDLWSIMNFAMPGVLGNRAAFARQFNSREDALARRRLAARVRPFVLRRTKSEVARDLPDRVEEDIVCELEGSQLTLYRAELKRARATLLKAKIASQLDKLRFNILTSLLRLRQICCHPALVGSEQSGEDSAKLAALFDLLEPLVQEGHKVLVFSQFVEMLQLIRTKLAAYKWPHLLLTGQTEDRGTLVEQFQRLDGACVFLLSLKAGGFGLNLTAASYVVLFDPWWNPAVENQAIDRTHRIGQTTKVIAYRLLVRDSIEEKIRRLQQQKQSLATDILGEETFAKALTLNDFHFLLGGDGEDQAAS